MGFNVDFLHDDFTIEFVQSCSIPCRVVDEVNVRQPEVPRLVVDPSTNIGGAVVHYM